MRTLLVLAALSLAACGPADTALRAPDGGLFNIQCKDGTLVRECDPFALSKVCTTHGGLNGNAMPNGLSVGRNCIGNSCCRYEDGGSF